MKMLKTKHFRRLAVFLAMIAPGVYLFGSLFSALNGAHGTQVFADDGVGKILYSATSFEHTVLTPEGTEYYSPYYVLSDYCPLIGGDFNYSISGFYGVYAFGFYDSDRVFISRPVIRSFDTAQVTETGFYAPPVNARFVRFFFGNALDVSVTSCDYWYTTSEGVQYSAVGFSDYVFGQFFAKDNFLVQWGENAISESPHGFAPFGAFWRYLDMNVLHLSNDQVGLMGYGYIYYACHVLLFDIGFILVTFFLDFIQKIADKFTGGE